MSLLNIVFVAFSRWRFLFWSPTPIHSGDSDVRLDPDAFPLAFETRFAAFANGNSARSTPTFFVHRSAKDKILLPDATAIY